jgi:carbonic anhydrase/acetyltransferase-like protein (isoleucine patch superfamily)
MQSIDHSVWIAKSAELYGKISVAADSSIWPHCVIRAECLEVRIGRTSNLQDFVMIHVGYDEPTLIGDCCSITHHATIHGATIEDDCLVGIGAVVMNGAVIGKGSIVAPGAVVTEGTIVPPGSIVASVPGKVIRERDSSRENQVNAWVYHRNAQAYRRGAHPARGGPQVKAWLDENSSHIEG